MLQKEKIIFNGPVIPIKISLGKKLVYLCIEFKIYFCLAYFDKHKAELTLSLWLCSLRKCLQDNIVLFSLKNHLWQYCPSNIFFFIAHNFMFYTKFTKVFSMKQVKMRNNSGLLTTGDCQELKQSWGKTILPRIFRI